MDGCSHKQNYQPNGGAGFRDTHVLGNDDDEYLGNGDSDLIMDGLIMALAVFC